MRTITDILENIRRYRAEIKHIHAEYRQEITARENRIAELERAKKHLPREEVGRSGT